MLCTYLALKIPITKSCVNQIKQFDSVISESHQYTMYTIIIDSVMISIVLNTNIPQHKATYMVPWCGINQFYKCKILL